MLDSADRQFHSFFRFLGFFMGVLLPSFASFAGEPIRPSLSLETYLVQVKEQNSGVVGGIQGKEAGTERSHEGKLLLSPTLFFNAQITADGRIPPVAFVGYDSYVTKTYSLGVSQVTTFGLEAKLHYDLLSQYYTNPFFLPGFNFAGDVSSTAPSPISLTYANASPVLELSQSFWSNGFGRGTRATQEQLEAQALASSYTMSYQAKLELSQAEAAYWRLALARQSVLVQTQALDRARKIYDWNSRRARLHLGDKSDVIQAEALVQSRILELTGAKNEERSASREFNSHRNQDSSVVAEFIPSFDKLNEAVFRIPKREGLRDDTLAAQQQTRASLALASLSLERDSPRLEVYTSLALNGQRSFEAYHTLSDSYGPSFSLNRPTTTVGVRFSAPLDFGLVADTRSGWRRERVAAEMSFDRKVFEQEQNWKNLNESLGEAKERLALSQKLELIQKSKLDLERNRLEQGRTTTYQVLYFEQDYLLAQLNRIRIQATLLTLLAQMKLFGASL